MNALRLKTGISRWIVELADLNKTKKRPFNERSLLSWAGLFEGGIPFVGHDDAAVNGAGFVQR